MGPYCTSQIVDKECCQDNLYKGKQSMACKPTYYIVQPLVVCFDIDT